MYDRWWKFGFFFFDINDISADQFLTFHSICLSKPVEDVTEVDVNGFLIVAEMDDYVVATRLETLVGVGSGHRVPVVVIFIVPPEVLISDGHSVDLKVRKFDETIASGSAGFSRTIPSVGELLSH